MPAGTPENLKVASPATATKSQPQPSVPPLMYTLPEGTATPVCRRTVPAIRPAPVNTTSAAAVVAPGANAPFAAGLTIAVCGCLAVTV